MHGGVRGRRQPCRRWLKSRRREWLIWRSGDVQRRRRKERETERTYVVGIFTENPLLFWVFNPQYYYKSTRSGTDKREKEICRCVSPAHPHTDTRRRCISWTTCLASLRAASQKEAARFTQKKSSEDERRRIGRTWGHAWRRWRREAVGV